MGNFDQLLSKLNEADEAMEALSKEDFDQLIGDIKDKIDGIKYFISKCDAEEKRLDDIIKEFQDKKKSVQNSSKALKKWATDCMIKNGTDLMHGEKFTIRIQSRESLIINENIELDAKAYLKYKGLVKRKYEWDKTAVKQAIKSNKFENVGELIKNKHSVFRARKGV